MEKRVTILKIGKTRFVNHDGSKKRLTEVGKRLVTLKVGKKSTTIEVGKKGINNREDREKNTILKFGKVSNHKD